MSYPGNYGEIFIRAGTRLICPKCRNTVAEVLVDLMDRKEFHYNSILQYDRDGILGISSCCLERFITFEGVFYTEFGAV